jgi:uncharacterized protein
MRTVAALIFAFACPFAWSAGFDCAKAASGVEKAICADPALSDLDDVLARYYQGARFVLRENAECLVPDQREWLRKRDACGDSACLNTAYLERLGELSALQPGINTQRKLVLPDGPRLAWAMAPEPDRVAAPPIASRPAEVAGRVLYDESRNGFMLRTDAGKQYLLLPDMMRGGANEDMLPSLARMESARFSARGRLAVKDEGHPYFDHRHCIYLHRLPAS